MSAPTTSVFVGREEELRKLCGLLEPIPGKFPAGRLPVITGAGGTGKSELVRQYASQRRIQYAGGVFQVDMEHVKTWEEAFLGILKGKPNNGVGVEECLGLKDEGRSQDDDRRDEGSPKEPVTGANVRDALLRRARESGPVLLVLDNVEGFEGILGEDGAFAKAFPSEFSERVHVNVVATARTCDVILRENDWAQVFPLGDLPFDAALELLFADKKAENEEEVNAAKRVVELLGRRALFLRRVPAILKGTNKKARICCSTYASLAKELEKDALETIARTGTVDQSYWPARLWEIVQGNLAEWGLGEACVRLIKIVSFFSSDGFPKHILRHLWNELVYPGLEDWGSQAELFDQVFDLACRYNIVQSSDPVRIHRLDREAILQSVKGESWLQDAVGKSLAAYEGMSPKDWLLLSDNLQIISHAPTSALDVHLGDYWKDFEWGIRFAIRSCTYLWLKLLLKNAEYSFYLPWDRLDGDDWVKLLEERPEYGDICSWDKLCERNWRDLLAKQPQFAACCRLTKGKGDGIGDNSIEKRQQAEYVRIGGDRDDWVNLLKKQPQSFEGCPWEEFCGRNWADLLESQPQFAKKSLWDKLDGSDWTSLLKSRPQFANECRWIKLNGEDWSRLLTCQPRFADGCPWELLEGSDWGSLLAENQDQLYVDKCQWELLDGTDWSKLLYYQPRFYDKCVWSKLKSADWVALLLGQPQFASRCRWDEFCGSDWARLLSEQPSFANRCMWDKLKSEDWAMLLSMQPQFAGKCPWKDIDGHDLVRILSAHPCLADKCEWERICDSGIVPDEHQRPSLPGDGPLSGHIGWLELVCRQPQFVDMYPWPWGNLAANDWIWLLIHGAWSQEESTITLSGRNNMSPLEHIVADMCKWDEFDGNAWSRLLQECPQFKNKCQWGN